MNNDNRCFNISAVAMMAAFVEHHGNGVLSGVVLSPTVNKSDESISDLLDKNPEAIVLKISDKFELDAVVKVLNELRPQLPEGSGVISEAVSSIAEISAASAKARAKKMLRKIEMTCELGNQLLEENAKSNGRLATVVMKILGEASGIEGLDLSMDKMSALLGAKTYGEFTSACGAIAESLREFIGDDSGETAAGVNDAIEGVSRAGDLSKMLSTIMVLKQVLEINPEGKVPSKSVADLVVAMAVLAASGVAVTPKQAADLAMNGNAGDLARGLGPIIDAVKASIAKHAN
jgi:hypothetical protein